MCTRTTTHPEEIHNTQTLINERTYAQGDQYTHHEQSPPNQYTRRTSTTVTTPNQYTINNAYPSPAGQHQSPAALPPPPHTCHIRQALRNLLRLMHSILPILGAVLSFLVRGIPATNTPPRTLIRVSDTRNRVLCSNATTKTTTRPTSANGAHYRVRTAQGATTLPCYAYEYTVEQ